MSARESCLHSLRRNSLRAKVQEGYSVVMNSPADEDETMADLHLRRLTVFVDEPDPGQFYWVLIESKHDASVWEDVGAAEEPALSWRAAWDAGSAALLALVPNQLCGPLATGEDENASPVGSHVS